MNGPHLKVRWVVAHWKHIDRDTHRERARERQTHTLQTAYICTHINHSPPSPLSLVYLCVCASISKVIQARKNFGNWKFAHKNLSPFSSCALAPLPPSPSLMPVCLWNFSLCNLPGHKYLRPALEQPSKKKKNCYLEHYRDARKLVEVLELFTLISLDVLFFISGHIL